MIDAAIEVLFALGINDTNHFGPKSKKLLFGFLWQAAFELSNKPLLGLPTSRFWA